MTVTTTPTRPTFSLPSIAILVGGGFVVAGSLLTWARMSAGFQGTLSVPGTFGPGRITAATGIVLVICGVALRGPRRRRWVRAASFLCVLMALVVGIYNLVAISDLAGDLLQTTPYVMQVSVGEGVYVVLVGAALAGWGNLFHGRRPS